MAAQRAGGGLTAEGARPRPVVLKLAEVDEYLEGVMGGGRGGGLRAVAWDFESNCCKLGRVELVGVSYSDSGSTLTVEVQQQCGHQESDSGNTVTVALAVEVQWQ